MVDFRPSIAAGRRLVRPFAASRHLLACGFLLSTLAASSAAAAAPPRGNLLLIGGGGEPEAIWAKFFELAGGLAAPIVILPTASERPEAGPEYVADLVGRGATDVVWLPIATREDAAKPEHLAALRRARGVFFTGGDQSRITRAFLDSPALEAIRAVHADGGVIAGTSAGLACMSEVMITGEGDFTVLESAAVETVRGLGFVTEAILDQHFVERERFNRLLSVVLERPALLGIGVDAMTAIWIGPDRGVEVLGDGSVVVLDATGAAVRPTAPGARQRGVGVVVHVLAAGDRFDLATRSVEALRRAP